MDKTKTIQQRLLRIALLFSVLTTGTPLDRIRIRMILEWHIIVLYQIVRSRNESQYPLKAQRQSWINYRDWVPGLDTTG